MCGPPPAHGTCGADGSSAGLLGSPGWPDPRPAWHGARGPATEKRPDTPVPSAPRARKPGDPHRGNGAGRVPSPGTSHRTHERNLMNKAELVSAIAKRADVPTSTVDSVLAGLQEELVDAITRGEKVAVSGLIRIRCLPPPSGGCLTRVVRPTTSWVRMRVQAPPDGGRR